MPQGLSLKIFGVDGERMAGETYGETNTQDLLMNNAPMLELTDLDTTLEIFTLREKYWRELDKLKAELTKRSDRTKQFAPGLLPSKPILGMDMFSQCKTSSSLLESFGLTHTALCLTAAFRYGPYVAHFSLVPVSQEQEPFKNASQYSSSDSYTVLRDHLRDYYRDTTAQYVLRAQFCSDVSKQPVEDASTAWDEHLSPWHDLATITFPPQDTFSDKRRTWWDDKIALSPFNGLEAHRPLGSVNRLRKRVYEASRHHRASKNGDLLGVPYFPKSADEMPE